MITTMTMLSWVQLCWLPNSVLHLIQLSRWIQLSPKNLSTLGHCTVMWFPSGLRCCCTICFWLKVLVLKGDCSRWLYHPYYCPWEVSLRIWSFSSNALCYSSLWHCCCKHCCCFHKHFSLSPTGSRAVVPVITSSMAVITVEMVITILGTDSHCNFCKRRHYCSSYTAACSLNLKTQKRQFVSTGLYLSTSSSCWWTPAGSAMKSAMLWIFLLNAAHKRLLSAHSELLFSARFTWTQAAAVVSAGTSAL